MSSFRTTVVANVKVVQNSFNPVDATDLNRS
jgi:hypothetical protein